MKFKIRFADQIVGFFIVLSLVSIVFVIVMLGKSQRWFSKDASFHTILPTAGGLSKNMAVQYRGFTIGNIKDFYLTNNDDVEVVFSIYEEYKNRIKQGSMVEMMISPVGLGNQFLFHAGSGNVLAENALVPVVGSAQANELIRQGLAVDPRHDDSISLIMNRASSVLDELNKTIVQVNEALGAGTDATELGKVVLSARKIIQGAEGLPRTADKTISDINAELKPILANINAISAELSDPNNLLFSVLDTDKDVYANLVKSLNSISGILDNLDKTMAFVPGQLPQVAGLLLQLRTAVKSAEDVMVALANNPLLRGGIPQQVETQGSGTSPRDLRF